MDNIATGAMENRTWNCRVRVSDPAGLGSLGNSETEVAFPTLPRPNMLQRTAERWRPLRFKGSASALSPSCDTLRRVLDLPAASIWRDLRALLRDFTGRVLDVGCGAQPYRCLLPKAKSYLGIDTVEAKQRFGYEVPETRYFQGTAWPVSDRVVDLVLATEVLEHVLEPTRFLSEARRCLRPRGTLILTVPFSARWHYIPHDYWRFTPSSLRVLLEEAGFSDLRVFARGNEITVACYKALGAIFSLVAGRSSVVERLAGTVLLPLVLPLAALGHCSLRCNGGDDCLGYTVVARKRG